MKPTSILFPDCPVENLTAAYQAQQGRPVPVQQPGHSERSGPMLDGDHTVNLDAQYTDQCRGAMYVFTAPTSVC